MLDLIIDILSAISLLIQWILFLGSAILVVFICIGLYLSSKDLSYHPIVNFLEGIVNLIIVFIIVPLLCIVFIVSKPDILSWSINPSLPHIEDSKEQEISIKLEKKPSYKIIGFSKILAKNCVGSKSIHIKDSTRKAFNKGYQIDSSSEINYNLALLEGKISAKYNLNETKTVERRIEIDVEAAPKTNTMYEYAWKEVWYNGYIVLKNDNDKELKIPFSLKDNLEYDQTSAIDIGCSENIS